MARDSWKYNNINYIENQIIPPYPTTEASLAEYYNQQWQWYMDFGVTSHITGQKASLELLHDEHLSIAFPLQAEQLTRFFGSDPLL